MTDIRQLQRSRPRSGYSYIVLSAVLLCVLSLSLHAEPVIVVANQAQALHQDIISGMKTRLETLHAEQTQIVLVNADESSELIKQAAADQLIVTIGTENTLTVLSQQSQQRVLASAIPRLNYDELRSRYEQHGNNTQLGSFNALLLDQPIARRLDLIQQIIPGVKRISLVMGERNRDYAAEIQKEVKKRRLQLQTGLVTSESELISTLDRTLDHSDVMLGLLDPLVFNRANSRNILLTAYRWRVPLVGISPSYVRAGALASVYSSAEQLGWQLAETIVRYQNEGGKALPDYQFPNYFKVAVNYQVAESMGLQIKDENSLKQALMKYQE